MRASPVRVIAVGVAIAAWANDAAAAGEDRRKFRLDYTDAAGGCPTAVDVARRLAQEVGYDPVEASASRGIAVVVAPTPTGFEATVRDGDAPARTFVAARCDDLVESVVLALALGLDPEPASPPPPASPPSASAAPTPPNPPRASQPTRPAGPSRETVPEAPVSPASGIFGFWGAGAAVGAGVVPGVSFGPLATVGLGGTAWEVSIEGTFVVPGTRTSSVGEVYVSSLLATAVPCWAPRFATWGRALVCGNLSAGGHFVDALVLGSQTPSIELAVFTGPRAGLAFDLGAMFDVRVFAELTANLTPLVASIDKGDAHVEVFRSPPVAGRTGVSGAVSFP